MCYVHEIETFHEGEIVEMTDHVKKLPRLKEARILQDDKFLIKDVGVNGILKIQNIRNNEDYYVKNISLQHIVPEVETCLL